MATFSNPHRWTTPVASSPIPTQGERFSRLQWERDVSRVLTAAKRASEYSPDLSSTSSMAQVSQAVSYPLSSRQLLQTSPYPPQQTPVGTYPPSTYPPHQVFSQDQSTLTPGPTLVATQAVVSKKRKRAPSEQQPWEISLFSKLFQGKGSDCARRCTVLRYCAQFPGQAFALTNIVKALYPQIPSDQLKITVRHYSASWSLNRVEKHLHQARCLSRESGVLYRYIYEKKATFMYLLPPINSVAPDTSFLSSVHLSPQPSVASVHVSAPPVHVSAPPAESVPLSTPPVSL